MAGMRKRIGIAVIDMQEQYPRTRSIVFEDKESFLRHPSVRMQSRAVQTRFSSFLASGDFFLEIKGSDKPCLLRRMPIEGGEFYTLTVPDEAQKRGYENVAKLLLEARNMGLPIAIVEKYTGIDRPSWPTTNGRIMEAAGEGIMPIYKKNMSAVDEGDFVRYAEGLQEIVVVGFHKGICVFHTCSDLISELQMKVITCGQALVGYSRRSREDNVEMNRFYKEKTEYYRTLDELLCAIRKKLE